MPYAKTYIKEMPVAVILLSKFFFHFFGCVVFAKYCRCFFSVNFYISDSCLFCCFSAKISSDSVVIKSFHCNYFLSDFQGAFPCSVIIISYLYHKVNTYIIKYCTNFAPRFVLFCTKQKRVNTRFINSFFRILQQTFRPSNCFHS